MSAPDPFAPAQLGPLTLRNRVIKSATFEGMTPKGLVTDNVIDYHRAVAEGGVGMTTLAYCAVSREGRGAPGEIVVRDEAIPGLRRFVDAMHEHGTAASMQLGHAGPVAANAGRRGLAPSRVFAPQALKFTLVASEDDLAGVIGAFAGAGRVASESGFDAVELHFGHGYLISAFLSPRLNKRRDQWGGTSEKRARLAREIASAVRAAVDPRVAVVAKLNMTDGVKRGLDVDDSIEAARLLESDGTVDAIELTGGSSFQNPMFLFRGDAPIHEMAATFKPAMRLAFRLTSRKFMPAYPFEEAFFLPMARRFRAELRLPLILLGGITERATVESAMAEGFEFVAIGRALLREPNLINRWRDGDASESLCIHCNKCMPTIYTGTHCVLVPAGERPGLD
ncbi:MAG TPA: NADH:flavin oxidoreductase [Acidimicrobiales bacterium]|nr:NADH:flavin oxidoreductase [Acidimicrobiales bacterium]